MTPGAARVKRWRERHPEEWRRRYKETQRLNRELYLRVFGRATNPKHKKQNPKGLQS